MDLTVIGFIIGAVALIIQLADLFPEHRETRTAIVLLTIGMLVGIGASALLGAKYDITGNVDKNAIILFLLVGAAFLCVLLAYFAKTTQKAEIAVGAAVGFGVVFLLAGLGIGLSSVERQPTYSSDEILALADRAERIGDYDKAVERLQELQRITKDVQSDNVIKDRISRIRTKQIKP